MRYFYRIFFVGILVLSLSASAFATFPDVDDSSTYHEAISFLEEKGIIQGYPDGLFRSENSINRAEALKILLLGSSIAVPTEVSNTSFPDFYATDWFAPYVETAKSLNIVDGYPDGNFKPANTLNLVEYLKMLLLTNDIDLESLYPHGISDSPFSDTPFSDWYSLYMQYAKDKNLVDTDSDSKVYPAQPMSRGYFSEIMYRFIFIQENGLDAFPVDANLEEDLTEVLEELDSLLNENNEDWIVDYDGLFDDLGF